MVEQSIPAGTIRYLVGTLARILDYSVEMEVLHSNPATKLRLPSQKPIDVCALTVEQVEALAEAIRHPELRTGGNGARTGRSDRPDLAPAVRLAGYCGLRAGELWGLRRQDVVLEGEKATLLVRRSVTAGVGGKLVTGPPSPARLGPSPCHLASCQTWHASSTACHLTPMCRSSPWRR
jgi:integrase